MSVTIAIYTGSMDEVHIGYMYIKMHVFTFLTTVWGRTHPKFARSLRHLLEAFPTLLFSHSLRVICQMRITFNVLSMELFGVGVCNIQGGSTYFERSRAYSETTGLFAVTMLNWSLMSPNS
jgi:hypothetical protein